MSEISELRDEIRKLREEIALLRAQQPVMIPYYPAPVYPAYPAYPSWPAPTFYPPWVTWSGCGGGTDVITQVNAIGHAT